jgi:hypothetical protein
MSHLCRRAELVGGCRRIPGAPSSSAPYAPLMRPVLGELLGLDLVGYGVGRPILPRTARYAPSWPDARRRHRLCIRAG